MNTQIKKINLINILLAVILVNSNIFAQQGWYNLNVTFSTGGIYFKDLNNGIIGTYKTTNAGTLWIYMGQYTGGTALSFPALNTGYGVAGGFILKTTNFGDNWIQQFNPAAQPLNSISFPYVNTGFACGEYGSVIKTTNGGNNWSLEINQMPFSLTNVFFTDISTGYLIGYRTDSSIFMKTTNTGVNWIAQRYQVNTWGMFTSMFFINANTGFVGSTGIGGGYIRKTIDGGTSWNVIILPTANLINSLYFPSASIGYAACYGGQILKTTNGGNNWFLQTTGTGSSLYSIFFINDLTGYVSGVDNTVLKTTDGGGPPIGIVQNSSEIPQNFALMQNFPNPFNPTTKIKFDLPKSNLTLSGAKGLKVTLKVYNVLGSEAAVLVNDNLNPGEYEVSWNAANFPSGIYFYRFTAGGFVETKKMMLVK